MLAGRRKGKGGERWRQAFTRDERDAVEKED
jgi:hypothetical protein